MLWKITNAKGFTKTYETSSKMDEQKKQHTNTHPKREREITQHIITLQDFLAYTKTPIKFPKKRVSSVHFVLSGACSGDVCVRARDNGIKDLNK